MDLLCSIVDGSCGAENLWPGPPRYGTSQDGIIFVRLVIVSLSGVHYDLRVL